MAGPVPEAYPRAGYAALVAAVLLLANIISFLDRQILSLLVTHVSRDLALDDVRISLLQGTAFAMFYGLVSLPVGHFVDRVNRKRIIATGLLFWSVMTICCGLARNFHELFLARAGVGLGEACLGPAAISILADYFPPLRRGRAVAVYQAGAALGAGASLFIGGVILAGLGDADRVVVPVLGGIATWQVIFAILGTIGLCFLPFYLVIVREPRRRERASPASAAAGGARGFVRHTRARPLLVVAMYLIYICATFYGYALSAWAATFYVREFGVLPSQSGLLAGGTLATAGLAGCTFAGVAGDRLARSRLRGGRINVTLILWLLALPMVILFPLAGNRTLSLAAFGFAMLANTAILASAPAVIADVLPNEVRGMGAAVYFLNIAIFGISLAPLTVAWINEAWFAGSGLRQALIVTTLPAVIVGFGASLLARRCLGRT